MTPFPGLLLARNPPVTLLFIKASGRFPLLVSYPSQPAGELNMVSLLSGATILVSVLVNNLILVLAAPKPALESCKLYHDQFIVGSVRQLTLCGCTK